MEKVAKVRGMGRAFQKEKEGTKEKKGPPTPGSTPAGFHFDKGIAPAPGMSRNGRSQPGNPAWAGEAFSLGALHPGTKAWNTEAPKLKEALGDSFLKAFMSSLPSSSNLAPFPSVV